MAWRAEEIESLRRLAGVYPLPSGCWATLKVKESKGPAADPEAWPEGVEYAFAVLMPGEPPDLRGERMAGVDNADDSEVRRQIKANGLLGKHRAHRHHPNWKRTRTVAGEEWPLAGKGEQLAVPPDSVAEFWRACLACVAEVYDGMGLPTPSDAEWIRTGMSEEAFRAKQALTRKPRTT